MTKFADMFYTKQKAAKVIGASTRILANLIDAGQIRTTRIGGRDLIAKTELTSFVERHTV